MLYRDPCVYLVEEEYQIVFNAEEKGVAWVEIGGESWRDSQGGLMRSETLVHRVSVPQAALDAAGAYTVCFRALPERRPYFPELGVEERYPYCFQPAPENGALRILLMADTHSMVEEPTAAAAAAGDFDLLALCGDIPAESKQLSDIRAIFDVTSDVTHGEKPVIFAQGNHDYRGRLATELGEYVGRREGCSWYTFRIGPVWCVVLDCGEDKLDSQVEYGGTICCHAFRLRETAFLRRVIANAKDEYEAPGVRLRLVVAHNPFSQVLEPPFDIEQDLYREWCQLIKESIHPQLMLCGHIHRRYISLPGSQYDQLGQPCPMIVCSEVKDGRFTFCGVRVDDCETAQVSFVNGDGSLADTASVPLAAPSR